MNDQAGTTGAALPPESASGILRDIQTALRAMDPKADNQWTADGQPRMDIVEKAVCDTAITREDVEMAWPKFDRNVLAAMQAASDAVDGYMEENDPEFNARLDAVQGWAGRVTFQVQGDDMTAKITLSDGVEVVGKAFFDADKPMRKALDDMTVKARQAGLAVNAGTGDPDREMYDHTAAPHERAYNQPSTGPAPEADDPAHQPPGPMISASDVKAREDELAERMAKQRVEAERRAHMSDEARAFVASGKPIVAPTKDGNFIAYLPSKIVYNTAATPQDGFAFGDTPDEAVAILEAKQNS